MEGALQVPLVMEGYQLVVVVDDVDEGLHGIDVSVLYLCRTVRISVVPLDDLSWVLRV